MGKHLFLPVSLLLAVTAVALELHVDPASAVGGDGSRSRPFRTVAQALGSAAAGVRRGSAEPVVVRLKAGAHISEPIAIGPSTLGGADVPVVITSDPVNKAVVHSRAGLAKSAAATGESYTVYNRGNVTLENTIYDGSGSGKSSLVLWADNGRYSNITIRNCEMRYGDEHGIFAGGSAGSGFSNVLIEGCTFHHNNLDGINTWGEQDDCLQSVTVRNCTFHDNYGEAGRTDPSGSGCVLGMVDGGTIEYCTAYSNGKDNTNSAGPVGIWTYDSRNVTIQFCESYNNRTSGGDGGGFDIDGGCTECVIQYCYSHDNDGPGYLFAQYEGADTFGSNIIRYNISENDGRSGGKGGIVVWGHPTTGSGACNSDIYGNTVYMTAASGGTNSGILFWDNYTGIAVKNNIFYFGSSGLYGVYGSTEGVSFEGNCWYGASVSVSDPKKVTSNPLLTSPGNGGTVGADNLASLTAYQLQSGSPCIDAGASISGSGGRDFYGNTTPNGAYDIGAHEYGGTAPQNQGPTVSAGSDQSITLPSNASLSGSASDDGLPDGSSLTTTWSKVSGPGTVSFGDASSLSTTASFSVAGTYVLRLTASDGELSSTDDVQITVGEEPANNQAPTVNAGADQTITIGDGVELAGTAADDGLPSGQLDATWTMASGPAGGKAEFTDASSLSTTATFTKIGTYVLRLSVSDGELAATDELTVTVNEVPVGMLLAGRGVRVPAGISALEVYDMSGREVGRWVRGDGSRAHAEPIPLNLPFGTYIIQRHTRSGSAARLVRHAATK